MGIAASVVTWLTNQGHDAVHLNSEHLHDLPDILILEKAIRENRIILTSDTDFGQLLAFHKPTQVSVIQFRVTDFTPANIKNKLDLLFEKFGDQLYGDFIITIEDNRTRFRRLPI